MWENAVVTASIFTTRLQDNTKIDSIVRILNAAFPDKNITIELINRYKMRNQEGEEVEQQAPGGPRIPKKAAKRVRRQAVVDQQVVVDWMEKWNADHSGEQIK